MQIDYPISFVDIFPGLKQTESDLEKLKCEKCNFQSYYLQQYQEHLSIVHEGEIFKCKCCNFSSFDEEGLNEHYKVGMHNQLSDLFYSL